MTHSALGSLIHFSAGLGPDPAAGSGAYAESQFAPPPKKPSRLWLWLLGGLGCGGVLLLLCCGGLSFWGISAGTQYLANALRQEIAGNKDVEENLGEINSIKTNLVESSKEKQARGGTSNWLVMDAQGTKGNGKFIVENSPTPQQGNLFSKIELKLPDGKTIPIK